MSTTPPPPQAPPPDGPAHALAVGKAFVRQYYKILSSNPVNIRNFYHPDSTILHVGTGGGAAEGGDSKSHLFADLPDDAFAWASPVKASSDEAKDATEESEPTDVLAIDFSAAESRIDAQNSVNGAILLVACGHMHLPGSEGSGVPDRPFIHTFVLACSAPTAPGRKKQYYVHNDVLRVMKAEKRSATAADSQEATDAAATSNTKADAKAKVAKEREAPTPAPQAAEEVPTDDGTANSKATSTTAPAQDPSANSASAETTPKSVDKKKGRRNRGSRGNSRSSSPTNANSRDEATEEALKAAAEAAVAAVSAPKVPESWASRVKTGGPPSVPPSPARDAAASKKGKKQGGGKDDEATTNGGAGDGAAPTDDGGNSKDAKSSGKRPPAAPHQVSRNPDATLIVKNIPNKTTNADIQALFDPYADRYRCPVRLISVIQNRNIAYVDFDHPEGVTAILRDTVGRDTWELNGTVLEVKRKSDEKRSGGGGGQGGGGGNRNRHRSASPGTGHHKSGGGGGKNYRKPSPRHQRQGGGGAAGGGGGSRGGGGK